MALLVKEVVILTYTVKVVDEKDVPLARAALEREIEEKHVLEEGKEPIYDYYYDEANELFVSEVSIDASTKRERD